VLVVAPLVLAVVAVEEAVVVVAVVERTQDEIVVSLAEGMQVAWMLFSAPPRKAAELVAGVDVVVEAVVRSLDIVVLVLAVELPGEALALVVLAYVEEDHA
jgi:hypothetical protein